MRERKREGNKEKRQTERKYLVFYLRVYQGVDSVAMGHLVNISSEGLMLLSDEAIPVNTEYKLRMRLPSEVSDRQDIAFHATSKWCEKDKNPDFYLTGFHCHDMNAEQKNDILCLIDDFSFI